MELEAKDSVIEDAPVEAIANTEAQPGEDRREEEGEPRGAFTFVILMIVFYIGYWVFSWFEIFATRGS
jgi:hypothetical protein